MSWQVWLLVAMNATTVVLLGLTIHWNRQTEKYIRRSLAAQERIREASASRPDRTHRRSP